MKVCQEWCKVKVSLMPASELIKCMYGLRGGGGCLTRPSWLNPRHWLDSCHGCPDRPLFWVSSMVVSKAVSVLSHSCSVFDFIAGKHMKPRLILTGLVEMNRCWRKCSKQVDLVLFSRSPCCRRLFRPGNSTLGTPVPTWQIWFWRTSSVTPCWR